jgi:hypothetical protein
MPAKNGASQSAGYHFYAIKAVSPAGAEQGASGRFPRMQKMEDARIANGEYIKSSNEEDLEAAECQVKKTIT